VVGDWGTGAWDYRKGWSEASLIGAHAFLVTTEESEKVCISQCLTAAKYQLKLCLISAVGKVLAYRDVKNVDNTRSDLRTL
jgi:hypothetical protein